MVLHSQSCSEQDESLSFLQQILTNEENTSGEEGINGDVSPSAPWDPNSWSPVEYFTSQVNYAELFPSAGAPNIKKDTSAPQNIQFIDQTPPLHKMEISNKESTCCKVVNEQTTKKKFGVDKPIDLEKSRVAQQRKRDKRGQFIRNEVANRLEELETQLKCREYECDSLRLTLNQRDVELDSLKLQFQRILGERANQQRYLQQVSPVNQSCGSPYVQMSPVSPYPIQTTNRNFSLVPSPNPAGPVQRAPFKEKIDYTKIQLRKTDSNLDDEKREVINSQEQWEERLRMREFIQKMEEEVRWQQYHFPTTPAESQNSSIHPYFGGAPSNIYPETQNKVGNLPVPAFTTKVDLHNKRQELGRRPSERSLERLLTEEQNQLLASSKVRIFQDDPLKPYGAPVLIRHPPSLVSPRSNSFSSNTIDLTHGEMDLDNSVLLNDLKNSKNLGGTTKNIFGHPYKSKNMRAPAFATKIDYSEVSLRKTLPPN